MRLVFLDTGPLGVLTNPKGTPEALACQQWVRDLLAAKVRVVVPAIADYELRRELIRAGKIAGLRRLDAVRMGLEFDPITQAALDRAAELWAVVRTGGQPTAAYEALDGDSILAAQALLAIGPGDVVTIATDNVGHLGRFVDARFGRRSSPESSARAILWDRSRHNPAALREPPRPHKNRRPLAIVRSEVRCLLGKAQSARGDKRGQKGWTSRMCMG